MSYFDEIREKVNQVKRVDMLSEKIMWEQHGPIIWQSEKFIGYPSFYPIYRWNNYYSFSVLVLILKKGELNLNADAISGLSQKQLSIISNNNTVDKDIVRIGKAHDFDYSICNIEEYCKKISEALIKDIEHIEQLNLGYTNIIMCGGKDSLNLLLLPWKNPVIAVSAEPNFSFVCDFVKKNNLNIVVEKLEDTFDEEGLQDEIGEACCRVDLSHWRWGIHLRDIVKKLSKKTIIWKGQLGDVYMSPTWKTYLYPEKYPLHFFCKIYKKLSPIMPLFMNKKIGRSIQPLAIQTTWDKSASLQGCHVGFIRALSDCLVLSAYHGNNVMSVFSQADLAIVAQNDIRPQIGEILLGKDVIYPESNPGPEISSFRLNKNDPELFIQLMADSGVKLSKL